MTIPKRTLFLSLRLKMLVAFSVVFAVVFAAAFWWFYLFSTGSATDHIRSHVQTYLTATALGINGDAFEQLAHLPPGSEPNSPAYRQQQAWLRQLHSIEPKEVSYTFVKGTRPGEVLWIGDPLRGRDPKRATTFMAEYNITKPQLRDAFSGSTINLTPYHDRWGYWVSGYMPILNAKRQVVGGLGVDFDAAHVTQVQEAIRSKIWLVFLFTYLVVFTFVYFFSALLAQPIDRLTRMASRVGQGDYTDNFAHFERSPLRDEISILGAVFARMVGQVHEREQTLKREVQGLRIEIDDVRKAKQVLEIVETDFFRDLKSKAQEMRGRAQRAGDLLTPAQEVAR
jgi:HAMP domain-containing protein